MFYSNLIAADGEVFIFTRAFMFKICKPQKKDLDLEQLEDHLFKNVFYYYGLGGLSVYGNNTINHGMHTTFTKRWHLETSFSSFLLVIFL